MPASAGMIIDEPGEYEISDMSIKGIAVRGIHDEPDQRSNTVYRLLIDDTRVLFLGHISPELSEDQLEEIGMVDIICIPVGGNGYTLNSEQAVKLVGKIEPKIIIPTHYADKDINYPVPQDELDEFAKNFPGYGTDQSLSKFKVKSAEIGEDTRLIVLDRA